MTQELLIRKIKEKAKQDEKNHRDSRFLDTMGFLVAKGFLRTNLEVRLTPNKRLSIDDAIWAGQNVEPRILEVLPAAVLRLGKHFDLDPARHKDLTQTMDRLRRRETKGADFLGMPYEKIRMWAELPLRDKRVKAVTEKKVVKTFRLEFAALERLRKIAKKNGITETKALERLILSQS